VFISCALKLMHGDPNFNLKKLWALKVISWALKYSVLKLSTTINVKILAIF